MNVPLKPVISFIRSHSIRTIFMFDWPSHCGICRSSFGGVLSQGIEPTTSSRWLLIAWAKWIYGNESPHSFSTGTELPLSLSLSLYLVWQISLALLLWCWLTETVLAVVLVEEVEKVVVVEEEGKKRRRKSCSYLPTVRPFYAHVSIDIASIINDH